MKILSLLLEHCTCKKSHILLVTTPQSPIKTEQAQVILLLLKE